MFWNLLNAIKAKRIYFIIKLQAIASYESGLTCVDRALEIYIESDSNPLWDTYFEQVVKMKNTR